MGLVRAERAERAVRTRKTGKAAYYEHVWILKNGIEFSLLQGGVGSSIL